MKDARHDQLLHEIFGGDELSVVRRSSLEAGLASLKRQRLYARVAKAALLLPVLLALILVMRPTPTAQRIPPNGSRPPQPSTRIISEKELFALFPNRPMALVGKPGHQRLVFLDQPKPQVD